ncbi:MAG: GspE/PulE family protein [Desulfobulbaceae bacterium]|nr:GspE/PulE family protein [Desulfobulbaceae bacterium]
MANNRKERDEVSERLSYVLRFKKLANSIHSAPDINAIQIGLREQILSLYDVEMATIYLVDAPKKELCSWVVLPGEHLKRIRIPISTKSIAGYVAHTGKLVNIRNVYEPLELLNIDPDLQFDSSWDQKTGCLTRQILAVPILFRRSTLGVIQLINRKNGQDFTVEDQKHAFDLSETLGIAFHNQYKFTKKTPGRYDLLVKNGILSEKELANAQTQARELKKEMETVLLKDYKVPKEELGNALAQFYGIPFEDLAATRLRPPLAFMRGVNLEYFRKAYCLPLTGPDGKILLAINDPADQTTINDMMQVLRTTDVDYRVVLKEDVERLITDYRATPGQGTRTVADRSFSDIIEEMKEQELRSVVPIEDKDREAAEDSAIVMLVRKIIEDAYQHNASDIHIEPYGLRREAEVRFRVDGRCFNVLTIPRNHIKAVVSRFKILAKLDISERRKPQDGKIKFTTSEGREIELRVATVPTVDGNEDVVLRVLAGSEPLPLAKIMPRKIFDGFSQIIQKPYGLILVVGPTGSGKTTTLHAALGFINKPETKIWAAEDPVEITQYRLRQVQVNPKIGLTFAAAMRAFLRADPDVIMVGEMRDKETASMGIEASLTGHLVFSTLHTNSAPETITRLVDMGMDPFNFADALLGVLAQRLVRTLCVKCRKPYQPSAAEYDHLRKLYGERFDAEVGVLFNDQLRLYQAEGCKSCNNIGYKGRMGLYELLVNSETIKEMIINRSRVDEIRDKAMGAGMVTVLQEGIHAIFLGHTDLKQVLSVCGQ